MRRFGVTWRYLLLSTLLLVGLTQGYYLAQAQEDKSYSAIYVDPATRDFSNNPKLLQRILSSPHGYFRFINISFSKEVCRRVRVFLAGTPSFNLHGDAHIEQYAVTDLGRGLTDFDDSSTGPAILDLMRFGVSLYLTSRAHGWSDRAEELYDVFLSGYRAALTNPNIEAPEPAVVKRIRSKFKFDRTVYLEWIDSIMEPMPQQEQDELFVAMKPYIEAMLIEHPNVTSDFFNIENIGYLRMGIGSALDLKYLVRIRGKTEKPEDDIILELKQVRDISGIDCIARTQKSDPFRVLVGQARIAYQPYRFLGYVHFQGLIFWAHAWVDNYKEVKVGKTFKSVKELAEVAYDVGVQLGRGHPKQIAAPLDFQLRREQLRLLIKYEPRLKQASKELADQTVAAWKQFRARVKLK
jgi:hypothetical protein